MQWTKETPSAVGWWHYRTGACHWILYLREVPTLGGEITLPSGQTRRFKDLQGWWSDRPCDEPDGDPPDET